jgi:hypothetical protein
VVRGIGDEHVAVVVERDAGRMLQGRRGGRAAIAPELGVAVAGDRGDRPVRGDPTDPVIQRVGDQDVAVDEAALGPRRPTVGAFICSMDIL